MEDIKKLDGFGLNYAIESLSEQKKAEVKAVEKARRKAGRR